MQAIHGVRSGATFDATTRYRYRLWREVGSAGTVRCCFVLLNPSTADAYANDPTVRRCIGYAQAWGFRYLDVVNAFAWRSTDPHVLKTLADPVGLDNDFHIREAANAAQVVVVAWGIHGALGGRDRQIRKLLGTRAVWCFGLTKTGQPKHPLYLSAKAQLKEW